MSKIKNVTDVNREAYNKLAKEFNSRDGNLGDYKAKLKEYFSKYAKTGGKVLEIGPGTGLLLQTLEELGCRTTAIELSEKMCEFARNNSPNTVILNQDIFTVEFFSEQFDIVCALAMIHTIPYEDAKVLLEKVKTWLKKGGFFILDTVKYDESKEIFLPSGNKKDITKFRKQYTQKELEELICSSGFKIDDISLNLDESNSKIWMRFACRR